VGLSDKDVQHIAKLARLEVSDGQIADYVEKLTQITSNRAYTPFPG
jgi:Asp-tRNA(Asn)/Glu-tRNA(Gln) amidotransferase C subunit